MITALLLTAFLPPDGWRYEAIPAPAAGTPNIPISVPSDWKTRQRSPGEVVFILPNTKWFVVNVFSKQTAEGKEAADSSLESLSDFRSRVPETVKDWTIGQTHYATMNFSSRNTRKVRPVSILSFDVWNDRIHVCGRANLTEVADVLFAQDFELVARSVQLPN